MNRLLLAITLILLGLALLLRWLKFIPVDSDALLGFAFLFYGLINAGSSLSKNNRRGYFFSSVIFLVGIAVSVKSIYNLYDTWELVFVSILFISGAISFLLFLENTSQKKFLFVSCLFILLSVSSLTFLKKLGLFFLLSKAASTLAVLWPVGLIILGIALFITRNNN